jgi:RNA polymerase sigma-70 factor (ECF subfamily)
MSDPSVSRHEDWEARQNVAPLDSDEYATLAVELEQLLVAAQPRLARLASAYGVTPDGVEDVVQETLVTAWQRLAFLHAPDRFPIWLNGICRNVSMRWTHAQGITDRRQRTFSSLQPPPESDDEGSTLDLPDPHTLDLAEELNRQDLAVLLDRAMGHLPASTRKAVELHYLSNLPQREAALQLGLTLNALEVKLHRARRQLRQILTNDMRAEAESVGLTLDPEMAGKAWRQSGVWCFICGRRRLEGTFEPQPGGAAGLRLRCPACSAHTGIDLVITGAIVSFAQRRSFRPAFKQALQVLPPFYAQALVTGSAHCPVCKHDAPVRGIEPENLPAPFGRRFGLTLDCPVCGRITSSIFVCCLAYPPVSQFILRHEHTVLEPEEPIEYQGQSALRVSCIDLMSAARLTVIVHRHTLALLALFQT